jgi:hypothetical protein
MRTKASGRCASRACSAGKPLSPSIVGAESVGRLSDQRIFLITINRLLCLLRIVILKIRMHATLSFVIHSAIQQPQPAPYVLPPSHPARIASSGCRRSPVVKRLPRPTDRRARPSPRRFTAGPGPATRNSARNAGGRREMAPQWLEKIESAPENVMASKSLKPQDLVHGRAADRALRLTKSGMAWEIHAGKNRVATY